MVSYIRSDLDFILAQIKIAEAHADGVPLYGPGGQIPAYNISWGLRTVDGTYNHLLPGQEEWGSADQPFQEGLGTDFRTIMVDPDGAGPMGPIPVSYNPGADNDGPGPAGTGDVFDPTVRTISNLIVDQTLGNPAAILVALQRAGIVPAAQQMAVMGTISAAYDAIEPLFEAVTAAEVASAAATAAAAANPEDPDLAAAAAAALQQLADAEAALTSASGALDTLLETNGIEMEGANISLPNVAPDEGLSASFNSWFTLFGQFFDHGLDLVGKGGSGTVFIPLMPDDPLYVEGSNTNFMVLTRATVAPGADGILGTADDVRPINTTTAFVDQNQTYASHASHQVFLRQYVLDADGDPVATGNLIQGGNGGMATWGDMKAQAAELLGIQLRDIDVGNVPLLATDQYGNFLRGPNGYPQIVTTAGLIEGDPSANGGLGILVDDPAHVPPYTAIRTGHAFLADIAHNAVPDGLEDGDTEIGGNIPADGQYDDELLDAHYVAGDGRANENIGLTAVHHVFHSEHNRLVQHTKDVVLSDAAAMLANGATQAEAVAFLNEWLIDDVAAVPGSGAGLVWDGERLFQAAKFGTEMQYQHLVFEEFARKVSPSINTFLVPDGFDATLNPSIVAEFAHVVYRFGHSMLTESIDRFDPTFQADHISLIEGFLNPLQFENNGGTTTVDADIAAGAIIRGMTRQVGNEIDEFVTSALRNNLLGLPLDLATINLARGRDTGVPGLNEVRRQFYEASNQNVLLKPYESWIDYAGHLKNEASIINFIAAYGTHALITGQTTIDGKRDAALTIITGTSFGGLAVPADAEDFLNGTGAYASDLGGLENVDLWIGGLAEEIMPFGGMLGSTFGYVFEIQLEMLQSGDRFYYLQRLDGLHLFGEMENNSFAAMIMRNTDATHLPSDVFSTPGLILEVDQTRQFNDLDGDGTLESGDPVGEGILTQLVIRNNPATVGPDSNYLRYTGGDHVVLGGTNGNDILIAGIGDDTLYGDGGNDRLDGGFGNDIINGGDGDDIIVDQGGDDNIKGGAGNDVIHAGPGLDLVLAGAGKDFVFLGTDEGSEVFAGEGDDFIYGNKNAERILGNEGNDWIETGTFDGAPGDNFDEVFAHDGIDGHDVFLGDGGFDEFIGEGGDDIMVGSAGRGKMVGMSGFDWATYKDNTRGVNADLSIPIVFDESPILPENAALDEYESVEGLSGTRFNDILHGTDEDATTLLPTAQGGSGGGYRGSYLDADGIALINGLQAVLGAGVTSFGAGDIILGGDGNDTITGGGGNDIIDGDKWLNVRISVRQNADGTGPEIASHTSMTTLAAAMFAGTINPGQLVIAREILTANGAGDIDTAVFSGNRAEYTISRDAAGRFVIAHIGGTQADGVDTLTNIEAAQFADQTLALVNVAATGAPAISDTTPTEGQLLTASIGTIVDGNGITPGSVTYQWQQDAGAGFVNIAGATNANFTPNQTHVNRPLRVVATFTDGLGNVEQRISAVTTVVGDLYVGTAGVNTFIGTAGQDNASGLGGNDTLLGMAGNDLLDGGAGNDTLDGGTGNDTMIGGIGDDTYLVDSALDVVTELAGQGTDTVETTLASYLLGANVENLIFINGGNFSGTGNALNNVIEGGNGNNTLSGLGGNDTLSGLGGVDVLDGGTGNDTLNGGAGNDTLIGGDGNDTLDGGTGNDSMIGGTGDDTFVVDSATDTVTEGAGGGTDLVQTTLASYTLGGNVENLTKTNAGNFAGTGNTLNNVITGGSGNNTLSGGSGNDTLIGLGGNDILDGGIGNDTMNGGTGNDTFVVDSAADTVTEGAGGGTDLVQTTLASYTLGGNVENLTKTNAGNFAGTGNTLNNVITGGSGNNTLSGGSGNDTLIGLGGNDILDGGIGNDTMNGGTGNDTYVVDAAADTVTEGGGAGTDLVQTTLASYTLGGNVENLTKTNTGNFTGVGNTLANTITGNTGNDTLSGDSGNDNLIGGNGNDVLNGGAGADILNGGAGNDVFDFNAMTDTGTTAATRDTITGFDGRGAAVGDLIDLSGIAGTFTFIGTTAFASSGVNQVRFRFEGGNTVVEIDNDGSNDVDASFVITGTGNLTAADFLL